MFQPAWSYSLANPARGLTLAREKNRLLAWDQQHRLYLLDPSGQVQAQRQYPGVLMAACCADDGSAYAVVGEHGEVEWLAPDLMPRWQRAVPHQAIAAAIDPLGQYVLVADTRGQVHAFDRRGRAAGRIESARPLYHLAFIPEAPVIIGAADFGLVGGFDLTGHWHWRDGPVSHIGSLAVSGDGRRIVLGCFTQGLVGYNLAGEKRPPPAVSWPCRLAAMSFDGQLTLIAWLKQQLLLLDADGQNLCTILCEQPIVALALGALGETAVAALATGQIVGFKLSRLNPKG